MPVLCENLSPSITKLVLDRPKKMNAMNKEMLESLSAHLKELNKRNDLRCLIITGAGDAFSTGADIAMDSGLIDFSKPLDLGFVLKTHFYPVISELRSFSCPIVMAVNGPCVGFGFSLALYGDLIVAQNDAYFWMNFIEVGLIPDGGSTFVLPRLVGKLAATKIALLAEKISTKEASEMGLVCQVYDRDCFEDSVLALAEKIAAKPPEVVKSLRRLLNTSMDNDFEQQLEDEAGLQTHLGCCDAFRQAVANFFKK